MAGTVSRQRTISLWQVLESTSSGNVRCMTPVDWVRKVQEWRALTFEDRCFEIEGTDYFVTALAADDDTHLLLHRLKGPHEWMSKIDKTRGVLEQLEADEVRNYVETSVVTFAGYGDVVALMEGGVSAPSKRTLEAWLNYVGAVGEGRHVTVEALTAPGSVGGLEDAVGIQSIEVKVGRLDADQFDGKNGGLATILRSASETYGSGDYTLTLKIAGPRSSSTPQAQAAEEQLKADIEQVYDVLGSADRARIGAIFEADHGKGWGSQRVRDLVDHHVTMKVMVSVYDDQGEVVQAYGAANVMDRELLAMRRHAAELPRRVRRPALERLRLLSGTGHRPRQAAATSVWSVCHSATAQHHDVPTTSLAVQPPHADRGPRCHGEAHSVEFSTSPPDPRRVSADRS